MPTAPTSWSWETDASLRFSAIVPQRADLLGRAVYGAAGSSLLDGMVDEDIERIVRAFGEAAAFSNALTGIAARFKADGDRCVVLELAADPIFDADGALVGYRGTDRNITSTGLLNFTLEPHFLDRVYTTAPIAICVIARDGRLLSANNRHAELIGRPISDLVGSRIESVSLDGHRNVSRDFRVFDSGGTVPDHEFVFGDKIFHVSVAPLRDTHDKVCAISVALLDITEKKRLDRKLADLNRQLNDLAVHDHLTGQFNRRYFEDALESEFKRMQRSGGTLSIAIMDVDFFKSYNDHYGHMAGDRCLADVAAAASAALLRPGDYLCRYGGEEFVAILADTDEGGARLTSERMRKEIANLRLPHELSPFQHVSVSVGVASVDGRNAASIAGLREELVGAADRALYAAKAQGRNRVVAASETQNPDRTAKQPTLKLIAGGGRGR
jgi:diguanylate cyclase (GGDEF)-like protein/PAS domain S-box-containing protein